MKENLSPMALKDAMPRKDALDLRGRGWSYKAIYDLKMQRATKKQAELEQIGLGTEADWQEAMAAQRRAADEARANAPTDIKPGDIIEFHQTVRRTLPDTRNSWKHKDPTYTLVREGSTAVVDFINDRNVGLSAVGDSYLDVEGPRDRLRGHAGKMSLIAPVDQFPELRDPAFATKLPAEQTVVEFQVPQPQTTLAAD